MSRVYRTDSPGVPLRAPRRDARGDLIVDATIARVGVMDYPGPDGTMRRELVTPETLFDPRALATLPLKPVTDEHPEGMFRGTGDPPRVDGITFGEPRRVGRYLATQFRVSNRDLAAKVEAKAQRETSPGYFCDVDETPGVWVHPEYAPQGERYDAIQGVREYDHLAVVPVGRCAGTCGDGTHCVCEIRTDASHRAGEGNSMKTVKVKRKDGSTVAMPMDMLQELVGAMDPAKAIEYLMSLLAGGGEAESMPETAAAGDPPPPAPVMDPSMMPPEKKDGAKPVMDAATVARLDALEAANKAQAAHVKALTAQLETQSAQSAKAIASTEVANFVGKWRPALGTHFDAAGKTLQQCQAAALKNFYAEQAADIDAADALTLKVRCDVAEKYDPIVKTVLAGASHQHTDASPVLVDGEDPVIVSERKFRERFANGKAA